LRTSEAVKNIPQNFREKYSDIPWSKIAGMRKVLMHGYSSVNLIRMWWVIIDDLPDLKEKFQEMNRD